MLAGHPGLVGPTLCVAWATPRLGRDSSTRGIPAPPGPDRCHVEGAPVDQVLLVIAGGDGAALAEPAQARSTVLRCLQASGWKPGGRLPLMTLKKALTCERPTLAGRHWRRHINHLFAKTGVRDRAQAVTYAYQHGLT
jgi:hypothetical protein